MTASLMAHDHSHHAHQVTHGKAFLIGILLNVGFVAVEMTYGLLANSSALLADAGHNTSDVFSLVFAWGAAWLATRRPTARYTYGLRRTTILVSLLNAVLIFGAVIFIGYDAMAKLREPTAVAGGTVMLVAGIGVAINTVTALLFMKGPQDDLNIKGAFLHMAADAGVSLGVVIGGLLIRMTGAYWIDPAISFLIIAVILWSSWGLFRDSINLALDAVPKDIDLEKVQEYLESRSGVVDVHHLHVWALSTTQTALTAHLVMPTAPPDHFLEQVRQELHDRFEIGHSTLQVERGDSLHASGEAGCSTAPRH